MVVVITVLFRILFQTQVSLTSFSCIAAALVVVVVSSLSGTIGRGRGSNLRAITSSGWASSVRGGGGRGADRRTDMNINIH